MHVSMYILLFFIIYINNFIILNVFAFDII